MGQFDNDNGEVMKPSSHTSYVESDDACTHTLTFPFNALTASSTHVGINPEKSNTA